MEAVTGWDEHRDRSGRFRRSDQEFERKEGPHSRRQGRKSSLSHGDRAGSRRKQNHHSQVETKMIKQVAFAVAFATIASANDLPRKSKAPRESYPNADVIYDSVTMPDGKRLRSIIIKPRDAKGKLPVIFLAGWLSCDSVEASADTKDATGMILRRLAQTSG